MRHFEADVEWGSDLVNVFEQWDFTRNSFSSQEQAFYEDLRTCVGDQNQFWHSESPHRENESLNPSPDSHQHQEQLRMTTHPGRIRRRLECTEPPVHRPEALNSADPPPPYARWDPSAPSPYHRLTDPRYWKYRQRRQASIITHTPYQHRQNREPLLVRLRNSLCELPKSIRSLPEQFKVTRAKRKLAWLRKYKFLSDQDRLLA